MISENKLKHSLGVARACKKLGEGKGFNADACDALFVMGFLHDIGYEIAPNTSHPKVGATMIDSFIENPEMLEAIRHHGKKFDNLSDFDKILNEADLTISYNGEPCSVESRLFGIQTRYGKDSEHYKNAILMAEALGISEDKE